VRDWAESNRGRTAEGEISLRWESRPSWSGGETEDYHLESNERVSQPIKSTKNYPSEEKRWGGITFCGGNSEPIGENEGKGPTK